MTETKEKPKFNRTLYVESPIWDAFGQEAARRGLSRGELLGRFMRKEITPVGTVTGNRPGAEIAIRWVAITVSHEIRCGPFCQHMMVEWLNFRHDFEVEVHSKTDGSLKLPVPQVTPSPRNGVR